MGYSPGGRGFQGRGSGGRRGDDREPKKPSNDDSLFWLIWIPVVIFTVLLLTKFVFRLW